MKSKFLKIVAAIGILPLCMGIFTACTGAKMKSQKISEDKIVYAEADTSIFESEETRRAMTSFAADLFRKNVVPGKNSMLSPLSAYLCLSMCANGAGGITKSEMEKVLGLDVDKLNLYCANLYSRINENKQLEEYLSTSNAIWYNDAYGIMPKKNFLDVNALYYGADLYKANFKNVNVAADVNLWVSEKTDGMIKKMLDEVNDESMMLLVNTLLFESRWAQVGGYNRTNVDFTDSDGRTKSVSGFYSTGYSYFKSENFHAFKTNYEANGIAFYGILPTDDGKYGGKDVDFDSVITGFDANEMYGILNGRQKGLYMVHAMTPCFKFDYEVQLNEYFEKNGMPSAFDMWGADFSNMYETTDAFNVYIASILQKTAIELDENGTKAAAATVIDLPATSADPSQFTQIQMYLDRPFIFMIVDEVSGVPLFVGSVANV